MPFWNGQTLEGYKMEAEMLIGEDATTRLLEALLEEGAPLHAGPTTAREQRERRHGSRIRRHWGSRHHSRHCSESFGSTGFAVGSRECSPHGHQYSEAGNRELRYKDKI
ncbi:hypothetical protein XELAEV_18041994mg [Xenopus laevis]|uniref:Uncharacterized protein n=1 Tax=Xenopus laevis TaxID=8355 RepID=A0A974C3W2_XENLA|nr:hypothetical protein XELAEV_18041994mg [Xenopus laevis]